MPSVVSATEARVHFGEILRRVGEKGETVLVEKGGRLQAVMMGAAEYERLLARTEPGAWREKALRARELVRAEGAGAPWPVAEEMVRTGREERDEHLDGLR